MADRKKMTTPTPPTPLTRGQKAYRRIMGHPFLTKEQKAKARENRDVLVKSDSPLNRSTKKNGGAVMKARGGTFKGTF